MKVPNISTRIFSVLVALAFVLGVFAQPVQVAQALSADIVISQVYGGGGNTGAPYQNDFIELFNRGAASVSLAGWSVQYASATGTGNFGATSTQLTELPSVSLAPGQYLLIQEASQAAVGAPLPTPDVTDTTPIAMAGTAGKVALVMSATSLGCNGGSTPCSAAQLALIKDLVGYGTANFFEGAATPALSNTTAAVRNANGCAETDNNGGDFTVVAPAPRNTSSPLNPCPAEPVSSLTVNDISASEGNAGTTSFDFTVSLSSPAGAGGVTFDIATQDGTATIADNDYAANSLTGQTIPAGSSSYIFSVLVNGDTTAELDETFFVNVTNVTGATIGDSQGQGTIVNDDVAITFIHDIQGNGNTSTPGTFTVEAIVVGDYQTQGSGQLRGFFIQEEDADVDADPATSEGIFVFCSACPTPVSVGDKVRVTGASNEFFNMSQLTASTADSLSVISAGNPLPAPASLDLPVPGVPAGNLNAATAVINAYFETFEGMLVTFPDTLSVSEYFELARYGQVILTEGGRPRTFTDANPPSAAGLINHEINLATRTIILDDTDNRQNRPVDSPNTAYYHPVPGLSKDNFFRGGDTITNLTGVLHWSFAGQSGTDAWRIRPVTEAYSYAFTPVNPRPASPSVGGNLKVASFNVLNYFLTVDTTSSSSLGACGPAGTADCRGADSALELERQRAKLTQALLGLDADIVGLMEMENTAGVVPTQQIVDDLNAIAGAGAYAHIDTGVIGTDAIRVGMIYKPDKVTPIGDFKLLTSAVDPDFNDALNRPTLAQTFEDVATGGRFTVAVNHLKSKGSACTGDPDLGDGQGNCNLTRTAAAEAMADWLATDPTGSGDPDVLIIGDLNSYAKEDPIVALESAGYTNMVAAFGGSGAYGYVFDGQLGYLDHALANTSLASQVTDVAEWHINADEIPLFDYNDDVRDIGESSFEEESDTLLLYEANAFRTSDHDPVVVGLDLNGPPVLDNILLLPIISSIGAPVDASVPFTDPDALDTHTATWDWGDGTTSAGAVTEDFGAGTITGNHSYTTPGIYTVQVAVEDNFGNSDSASYEFAVIYDPNGGFVTGSGWIDSPAGAYIANPSLAGKAKFDFNARYKKGATAPNGFMEFQFTAGNLNFRSTGYEWLVVEGAMARLKGVGTINGLGEYKFMITAVDGSPDTFHIKIWYEDATGEHVVYDNGSDQALGGGSITIHK